MPDDASDLPRPTAELEDGALDDESEIVVVTPELLEAWDKERPGLKAFLEDRIRSADEDRAAGRLIPHEEVFADIYKRIEERRRLENDG